MHNGDERFYPYLRVHAIAFRKRGKKKCEGGDLAKTIQLRNVTKENVAGPMWRKPVV
jgi:hypothetical protein